MTDLVFAATNWRSNAEMIEACVQLRYLRDTPTMDATYGRGIWWKRWQPTELVKHDLKIDGVNFCLLPEDDETYEQQTYDPPYVSTGGRKTSKLPDFMSRYGLIEAPRTPAALQQLINVGLTEQHRTLKKGGIQLVKCQDYVSSGKLWIGTHHTIAHALSVGFTVVDRMEMIGHRRPQPARKRKDGKPSVQQHARRNLSTLLVLRKAKR